MIIIIKMIIQSIFDSNLFSIFYWL